MSDNQAGAGFRAISELAGLAPLPGVQMNLLAGERAMMNWVRIEPGAKVPEHSHPHEQLGFVLEGTIILTIGDETREIGPESCYVIPGGVVHEGTGGPNGCVVMDIFAPPREDYIAAATGGS